MLITIETEIQAPIEKVWECWTKPEHITQWNFASDEWCCPSATNELKPGGTFVWRMEARDGSMGFDFTGTYEQVNEGESLSYKISDGRQVFVKFAATDGGTKLTESFEAEGTNSDEQQKAGWQAILENFKKYIESQA